MLQRDGALETWSDHAVKAGEKLDQSIFDALEAANIFIALVSPDYLASNYCYDQEFKRALELQENGQLKIVSIILEPCDWLSSPLRQFKATPKEGLPISEWTNPNVAYLDVVNELRRLASTFEAPTDGNETKIAASAEGRRLRVRRDFDSIEKAEFADRAYETVRAYFERSCAELNGIEGDVRAKYETMYGTAFTATVVNRALIRGGEAHITVRNEKQRRFGDISYVNERFAEGNSAHGVVSVSHDEYNLFLTMDSYFGNRADQKSTPEQVAERLWIDFVQRAGVEYE